MLKTSNTTLLILAAGLGSRYGGLKQLDGVGPNNEVIMEYSIHDAIKAGFSRVVFVISRDLETILQTQIIPKFQSAIQLDYVFQDIHQVPGGYTVPPERIKPWGTGHAILAAKGAIQTPFAVINADDFYGPGAFRTAAHALADMPLTSNAYFMLGYEITNTLSKHGGVSRGLCKASDQYLLSIVEHTDLKETNGQIQGKVETVVQSVAHDAVVSMNFWGFSPHVFQLLEERFSLFLENAPAITSEFYITDPLDYAIKNGLIKIQIIKTKEKWFGVTYLEDRASVVASLQQRIQEGMYPHKL